MKFSIMWEEKGGGGCNDSTFGTAYQLSYSVIHFHWTAYIPNVVPLSYPLEI